MFKILCLLFAIAQVYEIFRRPLGDAAGPVGFLMLCALYCWLRDKPYPRT